MKITEVLYNLAINLGLPLAAASTYFSFRARRPFRALKNKFSSPLIEDDRPVDFWLHGASVGEQMLVRRLLDWLIEFGVPGEHILVSAQTFSGLKCIAHPRKIILPHDYSWLVKDLCRRIAARHVLVLETEIWPNFYRYNSGKVSILNARMKEESYRSYRRLSSLVKAALSHCRAVMARSDDDRDRFAKFASSDLQLKAAGCMKWLGLLDKVKLEEKKVFSSSRPVLVAGSTQPGEEEKVLDLVEQKDCLLYLAPRHLSRIGEVKKMLGERGLRFKLWSQVNGSYDGRVIIVDRMGILGGLYGLGDIAFVGGTWNQKIGGHNLLEPLACEVPVISGPYLHNVQETADQLLGVGLLCKAEDEADWPAAYERGLSSRGSEFEAALANMRMKAEEIKLSYRNFLKNLVEECDVSGGKLV
ncbi:MAG: 3-deoxy-D-manno-octulosonic acid transferase [bacterium]